MQTRHLASQGLLGWGYWRIPGIGQDLHFVQALKWPQDISA